MEKKNNISKEPQKTAKKKIIQKKWLAQGRAVKDISKIVLQFTESISFDKRLALYDIKASVAHAKMLEKTKIISKKDAQLLVAGLKKIFSLILNKKFFVKKELEDIHMNVEAALIKLIGEAGKKLHTARSRNDQVLVDVHLYLKDILKIIIDYINNLQKVLISLAEKFPKLIMPGYTHLQQAQPVLVSHYFMAYFFMFQRDKARFRQNFQSIDILPLGAGALAGVNYATDRNYMAQMLGFSKISENSMDTVSNRDFMIEFISNVSILAMHFSRMAEDLIIWNSDEFKFIRIDDAFTTGSSIMPNKKNPDVPELIRGKTGSIYGDLMSILTLLKGLPLTYNRDLQEDKKILFHAIDTILPVIKIVPELLKNIKFNEDEINNKMKSGYLLATDIADYLVKNKIPFREAYNIVGQIINYCETKKKSVFDLKLPELKKFNKKFTKSIFNSFDYQKSIKNKKSYGSTSYDSVKQQIAFAKKMV